MKICKCPDISAFFKEGDNVTKTQMEVKEKERKTDMEPEPETQS